MHFFGRKKRVDTYEVSKPEWPNLMVTLWPSFSHFGRFVYDPRLSGIRLNSAMISAPELDRELEVIASLGEHALPLYYDVKGRQLRVVEVHENPDTLEISLNHPISVKTPVPVLFKAGEDHALLGAVTDQGRRLIFDVPPEYAVRPGESLYIRDESLCVSGVQFTDLELEKIEKVKKAGFNRFFLSYVQSKRDVDEFLDLVGKDSEVHLKIEDRQGLEYVATEFNKQDNLRLIAARGDLYVELSMPHEIMAAHKLIIERDPEACAASRLILSVVNKPVPDCADFLELAWLYDHGYRNFMLCDEICLKEDLLSTAVNVFDTFRNVYPDNKIHAPTEAKVALYSPN